MNKKQELYRFVMPGFVAGVLVCEGKVVRHAPILGRFRGQPVENVIRWVVAKGPTVEKIEGSDERGV